MVLTRSKRGDQSRAWDGQQTRESSLYASNVGDGPRRTKSCQRVLLLDRTGMSLFELGQCRQTDHDTPVIRQKKWGQGGQGSPGIYTCGVIWT